MRGIIEMNMDEPADIEIENKTVIYESFNSFSLGFVFKVYKVEFSYTDTDNIPQKDCAFVTSNGEISFDDGIEDKIKRVVEQVQNEEERRNQDADFVHTDKQEKLAIQDLFEK